MNFALPVNTLHYSLHRLQSVYVCVSEIFSLTIHFGNKSKLYFSKQIRNFGRGATLFLEDEDKTKILIHLLSLYIKKAIVAKNCFYNIV